MKPGTGYLFIRRVPKDNPNGRSTVHIWNVKTKNTLCYMKNNMGDMSEYEKTLTMPKHKLCKGCEINLEKLVTGKKPKGPKKALDRPEEQSYLKRWKGVVNQHPSFWEKMDKDPVYASTLGTRGITEEGTTMGTNWGIGRPKGPRGS